MDSFMVILLEGVIPNLLLYRRELRVPFLFISVLFFSFKKNIRNIAIYERYGVLFAVYRISHRRTDMEEEVFSILFDGSDIQSGKRF